MADGPGRMKRLGKGLLKTSPLYLAGHALTDKASERHARSVENAGAQPGIEDGEWWAGIPSGHMNPVYRAVDFKTESALAVNDKGIVWGHFGTTRVLVPWAELRNIELGEIDAPKGRQHSAFGFGLIGVAFVAATAVHNARVGRAAEYRAIRVTTTAGEHVEFLTPKSYADVVKLLGPTAKALTAHFGVLTTEPEIPPASGLGVADEIKKFGELRDAGVLTAEEFETAKSRLLGES